VNQLIRDRESFYILKRKRERVFDKNDRKNPNLVTWIMSITCRGVSIFCRRSRNTSSFDEVNACLLLDKNGPDLDTFLVRKFESLLI
jgi:hypothetical protein